MRQFQPHMEKAVFGFGLINPVMALPQIVTVWDTHRVAGLSPVTAASSILMAVLMTTYGFMQGSRALWMPSAIWVTIHTSILVGIIRFS